MKNLILYLSFFAFFTTGLFCIDYRVGSHLQVPLQNRSDAQALYHSSTDDYHFYGTNKWAVDFNFNNYFETIDSLQFTATKIAVYIPTDIPNCTVSLYGNVNNSPDTLLTSASIDPIAGWNTIVFSQTPRRSRFWAVIEYPTNATNRFVSASSTTEDVHSYFWQPVGTTGIFENFQDTGYNAELLVTLIGKFNYKHNDLELTEFSYPTDFVAHTDVFPNYKIRNNSDIVMNNIALRITMSMPNGELAFKDSVFVTSLNAGQEITQEQIGFTPFTIPENQLQYKIRAVVSSPDETLGYTENNEFTLLKNVFTKTVPYHFIENFLKSTSDNSIISNHEAAVADTCKWIMNYYPYVEDPFYLYDNMLRSQFYKTNSVPTTFLQGISKLFGYMPNWADSFDTHYSSSMEQKTAITIDTIGVLKNEFNQYIAFYKITRDPYPLFQDYLLEGEVFSGIMEKIGPQLYTPIYVTSATANPLLPLVTSEKDSVRIRIDNELIIPHFDNTVEHDSCYFFVIIQNKSTFELLSLAKVRLADHYVVANDDNVAIEKPVVSLFPNPCNTKTSLNFSITAKRDMQNISSTIYNIKGQKVHSQTLLPKGKNLLASSILPVHNYLANGVYFAQFVIYYKDGHTDTITKAFLFLH